MGLRRLQAFSFLIVLCNAICHLRTELDCARTRAKTLIPVRVSGLVVFASEPRYRLLRNTAPASTPTPGTGVIGLIFLLLKLRKRYYFHCHTN